MSTRLVNEAGVTVSRHSGGRDVGPRYQLTVGSDYVTLSLTELSTLAVALLSGCISEAESGGADASEVRAMLALLSREADR